MAKKEYRAIVEKVYDQGPHGAYVVASSEELEGSVTFSLDRKVWQEEDRPETGTFVMLSKLFRKRAGWRASCGRFVNPSDREVSRENGV